MKHLKWIELEEAAPDWNLRQLRECSPGGSGKLFCAVVKSNAYGHGVREFSRLIPSADWLAVNSLEEGLELRDFGDSRPILLLGHVLLERLPEALQAGLRLTVYNFETLDRLRELASGDRPARIHLKVETGTGRQGLLPSDLGAFTRESLSIPGIEIEGVSTHFANIEDTLNHSYAESQLERFVEAVEIIRTHGGRPSILHAACTAATILFPETHFGMLRAGIGLYGLWPSRETSLTARQSGRRMPELRPVLSWKTRVVQIKELPAGSYIGYGCTYRTSRQTRLGVLPVGYADGYDRALGNTAHVLVRGKRAPVLGRVCMNLVMVDLTDIPEARLEDETVLLGRDRDETVTAETMAEWAGTINYEVVTRISPLLPRMVAGRDRDAP